MKKYLCMMATLLCVACSGEPTDKKQMGAYIFDRHLSHGEVKQMMVADEDKDYVPVKRVRCAFSELAPRLFSEEKLKYMYTTNALTQEMHIELSDALEKSIERARRMPASHCN